MRQRDVRSGGQLSTAALHDAEVAVVVPVGPLGNTGEPVGVARGPVGVRHDAEVWGPRLYESPAADPAGRPVLLPMAVHEFLDGLGTLKIADFLRRGRGRYARRFT
ncbi:hypothetical protein [Streptomyces celluloflavus]|uniref:hypothetical protein n=1 Tax=Streptomyces celluloflavus TaxID=58344 RepID=UPI00369C86A6